MKNVKKVFGISLLTLFFVGIFITSCKKELEPPKPEIIPAQLAHSKSIIVKDSSGQNELRISVSANDESMLNQINEETFVVKSIPENDIPEGDDDDNTPLDFDANEEPLDLNNMLILNVEHAKLEPGAKGVALRFKQESLTSRYDRVSYYYYATWARRIKTSNLYSKSVKMKYYDDHEYAGYRSLCTTVCNQYKYTFKRIDPLVGCQFEYWSVWGHNVEIKFYEDL